MNIQQLLSVNKPFKTFYREGAPDALYMELPCGEIARAQKSNDYAPEFDSDFKFDVNDLIATDWELV